MPKQTFFNLPEEKQNSIINAAYIEFNSREYEKVGIRDICTRANINIASFYQYFEDKADFFVYLLLRIDKKIVDEYDDTGLNSIFKVGVGEYSDKITDKERDFVKQWYKCPVEILHKFYFGGYVDQFMIHYEEEFKRLKEFGMIRDGVDSEFASYLYTTGMFNVFMYYRQHNIEDGGERQRIKKQFFENILMNGLIKFDT